MAHIARAEGAATDHEGASVTATIERRSTAGAVALRAAGAGKTIGGYAIVYNRYSSNLGGYVEQCAPGLADKSLADKVDVLCRYQHESEFLLGRVASGTLRLSADSTGVQYDDDLPETTYAGDLASLVARGDISHSSFAFITLEDEWDMTESGFPLRTLLSIRLVDVAPVVSPAYTDTTSALRSLAEKRSLDPADVLRAAEANQLAALLRAKDPKVIDLGSLGKEKRDGGSAGDECACCQTCADAAGDCPGCDCVECRGCGGQTGKSGRSKDPEMDGQGATHPSVSVRRARLELMGRRTI